MIKLENVSKSYNKENKVIESLSLEIKEGGIVGFLGPNGAGKTTIIKMITGILQIDLGDIYIGKYSIKKESINAKKQIGLILDDSNMFLKLKGIEYLNFIANIYDVSEVDRIERIKKYSKIFNMEESLNNTIESYSHGMRQKIFIIAGLIHNPKNLILDEPITGLDPKAIYDLKNIMKDYVKEGNTVLFSTHILDVAENLCDRIIIINKGKILFDGVVQDLKNKNNNKSLEKIYMEMIENV